MDDLFTEVLDTIARNILDYPDVMREALEMYLETMSEQELRSFIE